MDKTAFSTGTVDEKIEAIIADVKNDIIAGQKLTPVFYLFDKREKLHVIEIKEEALLKKDRNSVLSQLIREKISDMNSEKLEIDRVLFLREGYYNKHHDDKNNMNLDSDFDRSNSNEALVVTFEDMFNFKVMAYDVIKIRDKGKSFSVLSSKPIDTIDFCKIDPECNVNTNFINLI